jgi:RCR-type E3 ubiquitin transferase
MPVLWRRSHCQVQNQLECAQKAARSCRKQLACGHACCGVVDEKDCPSCLVDDCKTGHSADVKVVASDECAICFTEPLGEAPLVVLPGCKHAFHFHCINSRLEKKWAGARIDFNFLNCPLCKKVARHPALNALVDPMLELQKAVSGLAVEKLKFEQLDKDKPITDSKSPFYNKPEEFAMQHYMFYQCFDCKKSVTLSAANKQASKPAKQRLLQA